METKAIVIVEDNDAIARLIQEVLNDVPGYGAVTVADAALAPDVVAAVHPDLVILDVDLPGISGFDLHDLLRDRPQTAGVPILFMSADEHAAEVARRGVPFLAKPFDLDDLLAQVHALLRPPPPADAPAAVASPPPEHGLGHLA